MKFTLKDYQDEAVRGVLENLRKARKRWREEREKYAFSLAATTGAGKTVMAAAVFEALLHGDDNFEFDRDAGAVIIWFSDDPSLNEQTRSRLLEASDRVRLTDLEVVQNTFNHEKFAPGKIYFLNTQKLSKNSLLVRGFDPDAQEARRGSFLPEMRPDGRSFTIWDTIQNTIDDPDLTLYLVLDEAHRGMGSSSSLQQNERSTIVTRLINGAGSVPAIPIVWGISATVQRFNEAMEGARGRSTLPNVTVDPAKVQESGLLKDIIILDIPEHAGPFDTVLVRRATQKVKDASDAWEAYARLQGENRAVAPLLVLQVPNTPDQNEVGLALSTVFQYWPELPQDAVAHVFGDHTAQTFGPYTVPHISPERVQESEWVRVLIAKDAISTGWDCPRAEVMISFRRAQDRTHITQLLGRMVRSPLARRIPGDERLNSVDCILPFFDKRSVTAVVDALMKGGEGGAEEPLPGRRVLINPAEMKPNPNVPQAVWNKLVSLPSETLPQKAAKPIRRLTALAHELAVDGLLAAAGKKAHAEMHKALDAVRMRYGDKIETARSKVQTVEGLTGTADLKRGSLSFNQFLEEADFAVIDSVYRRAARIISPDVARTYAEYLAQKDGSNGDDPEEALVEARAEIAALALVPEVQDYLNAEAEKLAKAWMATHRVAIKALSDDRQESYRQIKEMSAEPGQVELVMPSTWIVPTAVREANGTETPLPTYSNHLMCGEDGQFPTELNAWEREVLEMEMKRKGFVAWYRNPSRSSRESLGAAYSDAAQTRIVRPDFIIFSQQADGTIAAAIVDPHGTQFSDSMPKLRGLAAYAEKFTSDVRRVDSIVKIDDKWRVLDLADAKVRPALAAKEDAKALYASDLASDY